MLLPATAHHSSGFSLPQVSAKQTNIFILGCKERPWFGVWKISLSLSLSFSLSLSLWPVQFKYSLSLSCALGILNLPHQLTYNKGIFTHDVRNNNSPNYLEQLLQSSFPLHTPGITSMCQGQGWTCLKLAYPSLEHPSGTPCLEM